MDPETIDDTEEHPEILCVGEAPTTEERYEKVWAILERTRSGSCEFTLEPKTITRAAKVGAVLKDVVKKECEEFKKLFDKEDNELIEPQSTESELHESLTNGLNISKGISEGKVYEYAANPEKNSKLPKKRLASFCLADPRGKLYINNA